MVEQRKSVGHSVSSPVYGLAVPFLCESESRVLLRKVSINLALPLIFCMHVMFGIANVDVEPCHGFAVEINIYGSMLYLRGL